ncbi:MAG: hypothetical protein ACFFBD_27735, partial [Candidatus Hodarchaeota archaeon]
FLIEEIRNEMADLNRRTYTPLGGARGKKKLEDKNIRERLEKEEPRITKSHIGQTSKLSNLKDMELGITSENQEQNQLLEDLGRLEHEKHLLKTDLSEKNSLIADLRTSINQNETEIAELQAKVKILENQLEGKEQPPDVSTERGMYAALKEKFKKSNSEKDNLEIGIATIQTSLEKQELIISQLETEKTNLIADLKLKSTRLKELESGINKKNKLNSELQERNLFLENKLRMVQVLLESKLKGKDDEISELKEKSKELEQLIYEFIET